MAVSHSTARLVLVALTALAGALPVIVTSLHAQTAVRNQGFVPFTDEPINYRSDPDDAVARLQRRLDRGDARLTWEPRNGYLESVLRALQIPTASQMLVFSKTSFQYKKISPVTPRALYFNDDVYVGKVHDGNAIELISFDPKQGAIFYLLDEHQVDRPVFQRAELDCTVCHVAATTHNVPGVLVRSIYATATGNPSPRTPAFITSHESPLAQRFGGWYVTGSAGTARHLGNSILSSAEAASARDEGAIPVAALEQRFDPTLYLTPHSDIVAQMVHAHQTQAHNLLTLTNYQTRIALYEQAQRTGQPLSPNQTLLPETRERFEKPAEQLVRYLLFAGEPPLTDRIRGDSGFAEEFQARGPRDRRGRSLRDLDLNTRLFKYPLSYLVYSDSFDALPEPAKSYVYRRLFEILKGDPDHDGFSWLSRSDRQAIFHILLETKPGLPDSWRAHNGGGPRKEGAHR